MATFAFVHGSWHGAWCWELLIKELEALGHRSVAVDLPCDDEEAGCEAYARVVCRAIETVDDPIVVGHSLGGPTMANPRVQPETFAVYDCDDRGRWYWADPAKAIERFYPDCPRDVALNAVRALRPQGPLPRTQPCSLHTLPDVPSTVILALDDAVITAEWPPDAAHRTHRAPAGLRPRCICCKWSGICVGSRFATFGQGRRCGGAWGVRSKCGCGAGGSGAGSRGPVNGQPCCSGTARSSRASAGSVPMRPSGNAQMRPQPPGRIAASGPSVSRSLAALGSS